ncbi:MAG TPA: type II secretion system F family protein [Thermoanaerobaculia bacterium]|jgi:type IV pilus assembly protein PilC
MQFVCRYGTPDGQVLSQIQTGSDETAVRRELERQGCHIFEVRPRGLPFKLSLPGRRRRIPAEEFLAFNQEVAALLRAGLPLVHALDLMLERMEDQRLATVLTEIRDRVRAGEELSEAFGSFGDLFPPLYAATLRAGERSGELESVIRRFIRYLRLMINARKKVISALVYPAVLIGLSIGLLTIMAIFVVPKFSAFYLDLEAELPLLTQITLGVSFWLRDHLVWIVLAVAALVVGFRTWVATPNGRVAFDRFRLRWPALGTIFHQFSLSEFCRSLSTLLAGGIPLVAALETAVGAVSNAYVSQAIRPAIDRVREGQAFYAALEQSGVFTHMAIDMIKVGEATGSLDEMLGSVSDYFDERVETRLQRLLSLIEPVMLIIMGALIALILISIYLPMFGAFSQIGG